MSEQKSERRKNFPLRLSKAERAALEEKASEAGLKLSAYLREAGLSKTVQKRNNFIPQINRETYVELGRIGININQLAKAANTSVLKGLECNINTNELENLLALLQEMRLAVLGVKDEEETLGTRGHGDGEIRNDRKTD